MSAHAGGKGMLLLFSLMAGACVTAADAPPAGTDYPRQFGYVTTQDGTRLAYVVYLPAAHGTFPTVFQYEPYLGGGSAPDKLWLKAGYAVVTANVRGTGCSQGQHDLFGPHEGPDGADIIDWISHQPWSNRRVGMIGVSYPGHTQLLVAAQHPKALRAISPSAITMNTYDDIVWPGGIYNVGFASRWSLLLQPGIAAVGAQARVAWGDQECRANMAAHAAPTLVEQTSSHAGFDAWWKVRSLADYVERVQVPTFISQSWQDHETSVNGATQMYARLKAPKWMALSPGGHGWTYMQPAFQSMLVKWMDHWVKGANNGAEKLPRVTVYWELGGKVPPVAAWETHYADWPVPGAQEQTFQLNGDGSLTRDDAAKQGDDKPRRYVFGPGTELIGSNAQFSLAPDPTGTLAWTSAPLAKDLTILGAIQVHLFASSDNADTDFVVSLHDVYPNGDVQYLQRRFLRASMREIDGAQSTPQFVYRDFDKPAPLVPGKVYEFDLSLPPIGAVLRKGHKLQVMVSSPSAIPQPDWGLQSLSLPGFNSVYSSPTYPSRIVVPVLPDAEVKGPEPACGSLAFLPCRPASPPRG
ncbi:CocE/NonD family hydrolase [Dyella telluris]|uniref:CocE/NonD family hydrolase n=1 Tax=Dyella telluris TaxID=2763498 RepID=A0A7G8Q3P2_9GAMM|nr:CocE/NonD family hydrolase [Dyella telluris]QNK01400.1 CocE/NonD family hydrolase [Dyella telluris]